MYSKKQISQQIFENGQKYWDFFRFVLYFNTLTNDLPLMGINNISMNG